MRTIGLILTVLGALALGYEAFRGERAGQEPNQGQAARADTVWIPPVVGGIALVSGLLLTAVSAQRDEE